MESFWIRSKLVRRDTLTSHILPPKGISRWTLPNPCPVSPADRLLGIVFGTIEFRRGSTIRCLDDETGNRRLPKYDCPRERVVHFLPESFELHRFGTLSLPVA